MLISHFKRKKERKQYLEKWRIKNPDSFACPINNVDMSRIIVGKGSYGPIDVLLYGSEGKLVIGNYCSIAIGSVFCVSSDHELSHISSYPFLVRYGFDASEAKSKGDIVLHDDVWIGQGAIVLSGVTIGQGSVIGAGAVVSKDVPPYSIVVGNPGRVVKKRFSDEIIEKLMKLDYSKLNPEKIKKNIDLLYKDINEDNVDEIIKMINGD